MSLDNVEDNYKNYEIKFLKDCNGDKELLKISLCKIRKDINKLRSKVYKRLIINNLYLLREKILTNLLFTDDKSDIFIRDNNIINGVLTLCDDNNNYLDRLEELLDISFDEVYKLIDFLMDNYINNCNYIMSKRESLEKSLNGYYFCNNRYDDNRIVFDAFINCKIKDINNTKVMEKSIKM